MTIQPAFFLGILLYIFASQASAQAQTESDERQVVINASSVKNSLSFRKLLKFHERFQAIDPSSRDKVELNFFVYRKGVDSPSVKDLAMSIVGREEITAVKISPDGALSIDFDRHKGDELAEIYSNVSLDLFDRKGQITLKPFDGNVPLAHIKEALLQATNANRRTFSPFSSRRGTILMVFSHESPDVELACPGQRAIKLPAVENRWEIEFTINESLVESGCKLVLGKKPVRIYAS